MDKKSARKLAIFMGMLEIIPFAVWAGLFLKDSVKYGQTSEYSLKSQIVLEANCDSCANYFSQRADSENPDSKNFGEFPKDSVLELKCDSIINSYWRNQNKKKLEQYVESQSYFFPPGF